MTSEALRRVLVFGALASALSLGGCAHGQFAQDVSTLVDHGCKGSVHVTGQAGTATGLTPGSASATGEFTASCDKADAVKVPTVSAP